MQNYSAGSHPDQLLGERMEKCKLLSSKIGRVDPFSHNTNMKDNFEVQFLHKETVTMLHNDWECSQGHP